MESFDAVTSFLAIRVNLSNGVSPSRMSPTGASAFLAIALPFHVSRPDRFSPVSCL